HGRLFCECTLSARANAPRNYLLHNWAVELLAPQLGSGITCSTTGLALIESLIKTRSLNMREVRPYIDKTHPEIYKSLVQAVAHNRKAAKAADISVALLELVNLRVSQVNACPTCLSIHAPAAMQSERGPDQAAALTAGGGR